LGANYKSFEIGGASEIALYFILAAIAFIILYIIMKLIDRYRERKKLSWFYDIVEEKDLSHKQVEYLKRLIAKYDIDNSDEFLDSLIKLDIPKHIRVKLLR